MAGDGFFDDDLDGDLADLDTMEMVAQKKKAPAPKKAAAPARPPAKASGSKSGTGNIKTQAEVAKQVG